MSRSAAVLRLGSRRARVGLSLLFVGLFVGAAGPWGEEQGRVLGSGEHRYLWDPEWGVLPGEAKLGSTHGCVAIDASGRVYVNTDTADAVRVFSPEGKLLESWGTDLARGLHGMTLVREGDEEFLYLAHLRLHQVLKTTLDGEVLWTLGWPEESGLYQKEAQYLPTSIAVGEDGSFWVADGYGLGHVHHYDANREYLGSFGGPGTEAGKFRVPHGIWLDPRNDPPRLVVADRKNRRLQLFDLEGRHLETIAGDFRRPSSVSGRGEHLVIADLGGRVSILNGKNELLCHLGDNPDPSRRGTNKVAPELWAAGEFLAPHAAAWTEAGDLIVVDWNVHGRITRLERLP